VVIHGGKSIFQCTVKPPPAAQDARARHAVLHMAIAIHAGARFRMHADGCIDGNAHAVHDFEQFFMRADARSPAREIVADAFKDFDFPADGAQQIAREQSAQRSADNQCLRHLEFHQSELSCESMPQPGTYW
jgi:hypothetical protein